MKTYLLTWNPKRSNWDNDIGEMADAVKNGGTTETTWSCGNTKSIQEGDRIFFIQLGVSKKGIFASGKAIKGSYEDSHWETERAERGETCRFIKVQFDRLLDPDCDTILSREILKLPPFDSVHWDTQASGIRIADSVAIELEKLWRQYAGIAKYNLSDEIHYDKEIAYERERNKINRKTLNAEERASEETARLVFEYIFKNDKIIKTSAQILADSIRLAHQMGDQCWSLTLYPSGVRLNVGPVEVLVLREGEIYLILDGSLGSELVTGEIGKYITASEIFYPSVPIEQIRCYLPAEKFADLYPMIAEAHQAFIAEAAKRRKISTWRSSFSLGVILYLNRLLNTSLPVPTYISEQLETEIIFPDEIVAIKSFYGGAVSQVTVNVYERDPQARKACIEHYGLNCHVCDFNFEQVYGERGAGFIHVHHLRPVSEGEYNLNPVDDLRPVCPNCHAMIHRYGLLSIEELKILINRK